MKNTVIEGLARAIDTIGKRDFYPVMIEYLYRCLGFDNVIIIVFIDTAVPNVLYKKIYGPDVFRYLAEQYLPAAYLLDPIYHFHLRRGEPGIYRLLDMAPDQFRRSRYFKWYYGRIGITDEISVVLPIGDNATITISMGKDGSTGQVFSQAAEERLRSNEPAIMSLLRAHWSVSETPPRTARPSQSITDSLIAAMRTDHSVMLSKRQAEVALLILQGHSSPSIGLNLGVSHQTVKVFRKQLYRKCNLSCQAELFALMMPILEDATNRAALSNAIETQRG